MVQDPASPGNIRIGHPERDGVIAVLQEAAADGRLSIAELEDRLDAAMRAKTYADLDPLVADLSVQTAIADAEQRPATAIPATVAWLLPRGSTPSGGHEQREAPRGVDGAAVHRSQPGPGFGQARPLARARRTGGRNGS